MINYSCDCTEVSCIFKYLACCCCFSFCFSDVNECSPVYVESLNKTIIPAGCDQICHNTAGNYTCSCNQGFGLLFDGKRCRGKRVSLGLTVRRKTANPSLSVKLKYFNR